jgi:hypothetical protein
MQENMQENMQEYMQEDMQEKWQIWRSSYFAYIRKICTPQLADVTWCYMTGLLHPGWHASACNDHVMNITVIEITRIHDDYM